MFVNSLAQMFLLLDMTSTETCFIFLLGSVGEKDIVVELPSDKEKCIGWPRQTSI